MLPLYRQRQRSTIVQSRQGAILAPKSPGIGRMSVYRMSAEFDYDAGTDSLCIKLLPGELLDNRIIGEDIVIDIGLDGEPVGYAIQHASRHPQAIAEALGYLHQRHAA